MVLNIYQALSISLPDYATQKNAVSVIKITTATAKLIRTTIELSNKIFLLSSTTLLVGKGTYFISAIPLPGSVYCCLISFFKISKVHSIYTARLYVCEVIQNVGIVSKDAINLLKGMKAFGHLQERYFWMVKPTPLCAFIGMVSLISRLYGQIIVYVNCRVDLFSHDAKLEVNSDNRQNLNKNLLLAKISVVSCASELAGMTILSLSPLIATSVAIPAYSFLTLSAITHLAQSIL